MDYYIYQLKVPKITDWNPSQAVASMKAICDYLSKDIFFSFVVTGTTDGVTFCMEVEEHPKVSADSLADILSANYSGFEFSPYLRPDNSYPFFRRITTLSRMGAIWFDDLAPKPAYQQIDPLTVVTKAMTKLKAGERISYTVTCKMAKMPQEKMYELLTQSAYDAGYRGTVRYSPYTTRMDVALLGMLGKVFEDWRLQSKRILRYSDEDTTRYARKLALGHAGTRVTVMMDSPSKERLGRMSAVVSAIINLTGKGAVRLANGITEGLRVTGEDEDSKFYPGSYLFYNRKNPETVVAHTLYLQAEELSYLWHLPHEGFEDQPIMWALGIPIQAVQPDDDAIQIGTISDYGNTPAFLSRPDREYHTYVSGQTGMGKSTLLHNLIHQDIEAGEGIAVLDPHGSLISEILSKSIPEWRLQDVVLLSCDDKASPVPVNPFRRPDNVDPEHHLNAVLWLMKTLYKEHWSTTRMETTMRSILQLILADESATPLDILEVIDNPKFRQHLFNKLEKEDRLSRTTERFWKNFDNLPPSERSAQTQPIVNRMSALLGTPHLENMTCHPQSIDFRELMLLRKIVLIDLSGDSIAAEVDTLGAIFFINMFLASQSRFFEPLLLKHPFYLYIDETQRFLATAFPQMFTESRKFGLWMTLANQYIGQLDEATQEAITNTVGTKVSFECSPEEARRTAKLYEPEIAQEQMTRFGRGRAAIRTRYNGETLGAFVINTLPPPQPISKRVQSRTVAKTSRENLKLLPVGKVKAWIKQRYADELPSSPTGLTDFE